MALGAAALPETVAPDAASRERTALEGGFALYVHWPYCRHKCPYCDFNSHVRRQIDVAAFARALLAELDHHGAETRGRRLTSVFFGGGTPSLMPPALVADVLDRAARWWQLGSDLEVTLEANPTSAEAERFRSFRAAGVNRLSLGIQALDPEGLARLGRRHTVEEALAALDRAAAVFPRWSCDLITARPGHTPRGWRRELLRLAPHLGDHVSVYELTVEPGTRFWTLYHTGRLQLPDEELRLQLDAVTAEVLGGLGFSAYEPSNWARPGGACRHNLVYWRSGDWVGIGPGAHGRLTLKGERLAIARERRPEAWLQAVAARGSGEVERRPLSAREIAEEMVLMGLRLAEGIHLARLERLAGLPLDAILRQEMVESLVASGDLHLDEGRLRTTGQGRARLDAVIAAILR